MAPHPKVLLIIPAYNEATVIAETIKSIKQKTKNWPLSLVVVDDGSQDETFDIAKSQKITVLHHVLNRGLGGAIGTGLAYANKIGADIAITFDADGQHDPLDIRRVIQPILKKKADVVIGSRTLSTKGKVPWDRVIIHKLSNWVTFLLFGKITSDSQSGFRAFNKKAIQNITIKTERMEVSSELFAEIKRLKLKLAEVPIKVIYTEYSRQKGQTNLNGLNVLFKLIVRLFR